MSVITKPISIEKGQDNIIELDKGEVASLADVLASDYFSDQDNWKRIVLTYQSDEGGQTN